MLNQRSMLFFVNNVTSVLREKIRFLSSNNFFDFAKKYVLFVN